MSITAEEVKKLAALSRIKLSDDEVVTMQQEIGSVLSYLEQLNTASLQESEAGSVTSKNVWREDAEPYEPGGYTEKLLREAPARKENYIKVKKIL
jgi:aspartyl-tRNA(Asn)/glutamyl-tRNA(Gln) amidotransferase subunit C